MGGEKSRVSHRKLTTLLQLTRIALGVPPLHLFMSFVVCGSDAKREGDVKQGNWMFGHFNRLDALSPGGQRGAGRMGLETLTSSLRSLGGWPCGQTNRQTRRPIDNQTKTKYSYYEPF